MTEPHIDEQVTVFGDGVQPPALLQPPAVQVALFAGQVECGSCPLGTLAQVPRDEARLHCLQPLHNAPDTLQHSCRR